MSSKSALENFLYIEIMYDDKSIAEFQTATTKNSFLGIKIIENINSLFPIIELTFIDSSYVFTETKSISSDKDFIIKIGNNQDDYKKYEYKIFNILKMDNLGDVSNIVYKISLVPKFFYDLLDINTRSFSNKNISDTVKDIVNEFNITEIFIEDTISNDDFKIVQPSISNLKFLNILKSKAINTKKVSGYFCFFDREFNFIFGTSNYIYTDLNKNREEHNLYYAKSEDGITEYDTFNNYSVVSKSNNEYIGNKSGKVYGFLYSDRKYLEKEVNFTNGNTKTLSNYVMITETQEKRNNTKYNDTMIFIEDELGSYNQGLINKSACTLFNVTVRVYGNIKYKLGDICRLYFTNKQTDSSEVLESLSGYYFISKIINEIINNKYSTILVLSREGYNNKSIDGFIQSPNGKIK